MHVCKLLPGSGRRGRQCAAVTTRRSLSNERFPLSGTSRRCSMMDPRRIVVGIGGRGVSGSGTSRRDSMMNPRASPTFTIARRIESICFDLNIGYLPEGIHRLLAEFLGVQPRV